MAVAVEQLGFDTLWVSGSPGGDLQRVEEYLDATRTIAVSTGVINIWREPAELVAESYHRVERRHPGRFLLGIGAGHPEINGEQYVRPRAAMESYLDVLDAAGVPPERRVLAALGPRMLELSAARASGTHPYLVAAEHSRRARAAVGAALVAPEHKVVVGLDADAARDRARALIAHPYLDLSNYRNSLLTHGFTEADLADGGSDALIDALAAHGDADRIRGSLVAHLDAGADHVAANPLVAEDEDPIGAFEYIAAAVLGR